MVLSFILAGILTASECFKLRKTFKGLTNEIRPNFYKKIILSGTEFPRLGTEFPRLGTEFPRLGTEFPRLGTEFTRFYLVRN